MTIAEVKAYEVFKEKLGEKEAATVIEYLESKVDTKFRERQDVLATRSDIADMRAELKETKSEMIKWMFLFWIGQMAATLAIVKLAH